MESLRPEQKKEKCTVTFFLGLFFVCSIALLVSVVFLLRSRKVVDNKSTTSFLEMIFPLYWLYAYIIFHMVLYALNVYLWRRFGINYTLIFGFKQGTELGFREVLSLSIGLAALTLTTFLAHLHLKIDSRDTRYAKYIDLITLALVIVILFITFMPVNILYLSSRFFFIRTLYRCVCAPLYKVTFSDFFLADHLTSQIEAIRSFEVYICYFSFLEYYDISSKCHRNDAFNIFHLIIAIIPYWIRFLQCLRRFFKEKDATQGYNGLRYLLTVAALLVRTAFEAWKGNAWKVLAVVSSIASTLLNVYWDIVMDWGLLQRHSKNFLLRDRLCVQYKSIYFAAMAMDSLLRFAWLQLFLKFNLPSLRKMAVLSTFSFLEVFRRGMWSFFRLENEHLNTVGIETSDDAIPSALSMDT